MKGLIEKLGTETKATVENTFRSLLNGYLDLIEERKVEYGPGRELNDAHERYMDCFKMAESEEMLPEQEIKRFRLRYRELQLSQYDIPRAKAA